nr:MAG TPA: hypothetical protein [Caudoviricetes sp.]
MLNINVTSLYQFPFKRTSNCGNILFFPILGHTDFIFVPIKLQVLTQFSIYSILNSYPIRGDEL